MVQVPPSSMRISARLAKFFSDATSYNLRLEATALACMLEYEAATFSTVVAFDALDLPSSTPPLVALVRVILNLQRFLIHVQAHPQPDQKVVIRKLRNAKETFDTLMESCYHGTLVSQRPHAEQSDMLAQLLAQAIPEYVAFLCDDKWSASGT